MLSGRMQGSGIIADQENLPYPSRRLAETPELFVLRSLGVDIRHSATVLDHLSHKSRLASAPRTLDQDARTVRIQRVIKVISRRRKMPCCHVIPGRSGSV